MPSDEQKKRQVFMISDGTGITVSSLGNSLLTQFENIEFQKNIIPYIDSVDKAISIRDILNSHYNTTKEKALVFMTLLNPEINNIIKTANACIFDFMYTFLDPLEVELKTKSSDTIGKAHTVVDNPMYEQRIKAINFALNCDDGVQMSLYDAADIILIGVSRSGKTPSCLYMALQFGVFAANYPLTADDETHHFALPEILRSYKHKLFGLSIDPERLHHIRNERRPNSTYASLQQCRLEVNEVETLYKNEHIPFLNSTRYSIEEIVTKILSMAKIQRKIL
jgi:[pyruvate, water dikinase]-phosphate phosphotransferase / [pyruvate, water dikinase] kinase